MEVVSHGSAFIHTSMSQVTTWGYSLNCQIVDPVCKVIAVGVLYRMVKHIRASARHTGWACYAGKHSPAAKFHVMTTGVATSVIRKLKPRSILAFHMSSGLRFTLATVTFFTFIV